MKCVGKPNLPYLRDFNKYVSQIWQSGHLTNNGPLVRELESRIEDYLSVRHCVLVANGTLGLEIAALAHDLTGEVIVPSWTFAATAQALSWIGLTPVFADVGTGHHLDPGSVEAQITSRTTAIIPVHVWGQTGRLDDLWELSCKYSLPLICDAAHAFGCSHRGSMVGNLGDCEVFSFHATKFFGTFEGGAITTNDPELASRCRRMRTFGFENYEVVDIGTNAKMSEVHAAMGLGLMDHIDQISAINRCIYNSYRQRLGDMMVLYDEAGKHNYQYVVIESEHRDEIMVELAKVDILARRYFYPGVHQCAPYQVRPQSLPNTEELALRTLCLPTGPQMSDSDINQVCDIVEGVCR